MRDATEALERLCAREAEVSAHYVIGTCGTLWHLVKQEDRAWHAGAGAWQGLTDINSRSIGIELVNSGAHPFPEPQMRKLEMLMTEIMEHWRIPPENVIGHSDMAPERKEDPGPHFDWRRLALQRLAVWPEGYGEDKALETSLDSIGYPKATPGKRLQAFRFRFLPWVTGPETATDRRRADAVAAALSMMLETK